MVFWFPEQSGSWFKRMWPTIAWINYMAYKISCPGWLEFLLEHGRSRFITKEGTEVKHPLTEAPLWFARVSFAACTYKREEPQLFESFFVQIFFSLGFKHWVIHTLSKGIVPNLLYQFLVYEWQRVYLNTFILALDLRCSCFNRVVRKWFRCIPVWRTWESVLVLWGNGNFSPEVTGWEVIFQTVFK